MEWEFYIGDTYERNFIIKKYNSSIDEIYFSVKKNDGDKKTVLQKTLDNGITLVEDEVIDDVRNRTYQLSIAADETETMTPDIEYSFDIEIVTNTDTSPLKKTILTGTLILTNATTRIWNE